MMRHWLGGVPLDTDHWWVRDDSSGTDHGSLSEIIAPQVAIPLHDGVIVGRGVRGIKTNVLDFSVRAPDRDLLEARLDELLAVVDCRVPTLLLKHPSGSLSPLSRQALVIRRKSTGIVRRTMQDFRAYFSVEFELSSGKWLDATPVSDVLVKPSGVQDWTATLSNWAGGSAPSSDVQVRFAGIGATTDVRVTDVDTGAWLRVAGNIPAGAVVTVDPQAYTASTPSGDISGLLDFGPIPFQISPPAQVRVQQNGSQNVTISGRRAYV